jgi:hypothetical protein
MVSPGETSLTFQRTDAEPALKVAVQVALVGKSSSGCGCGDRSTGFEQCTVCSAASKGSVASIVRIELAMSVAVASCSVGPAIANPETLYTEVPAVTPNCPLGAISVMTPFRMLPVTVNAGLRRSELRRSPQYRSARRRWR